MEANGEAACWPVRSIVLPAAMTRPCASRDGSVSAWQARRPRLASRSRRCRSLPAAETTEDAGRAARQAEGGKPTQPWRRAAS